MDSKKTGIMLLVISALLIIIFIFSFRNLSVESEQLGCFSNDSCKPIQTSFTLVNIGFGFLGFILALAFYLLVFSPGEKALLGQLEQQKQKTSNDEKFEILMKGLDEFEQNIITEVRKQDGITQNTLALRVNMSKAKLSQVLGNLEKKGLIKRNQHKKTLTINLAVDF